MFRPEEVWGRDLGIGMGGGGEEVPVLMALEAKKRGYGERVKGEA